MNRREFFKQTTFAGALGAAGLAPAAEFSSFQAGFAERDITPEIGMEEPGGYGKSYHKKFHDPCKVRAAVFQHGQTTVALVGLDALAVPRPAVLAARRLIREQCHIPEDAVLIGASHSHSSGPIQGVLPGQYDGAPPLVKRLAYEYSTCVNASYMQRVVTEIATAVCQAASFRKPALCGIGKGREDKVAFNRRHRMKNGLSYTHPHQGNPEMLGYAGPIDPEVGVIGAWDESGRLMGCVVNYACHATTSPGGISANWIHYLEHTIQGALASDAPVVYLQGACGDITQVDNLSPYRYPSGDQWARLVGGCVGAEAVKVLLSMEPGSLAPLAAKSTVLRIPRRKPDPDHLRRSYQMMEGDPKVNSADWTFAKEIVLLDYLIKQEPVVDVEVQAVQVGPAVFLTNPAEFFCQYGLDLKARSGFPFTFPVELANGLVGYVPTEEAFGPHGGGYETRLTSYSNLEITAGRQMVDAGLHLAGSLTPGKLPHPPAAPAFHESWSYGNVPPELS